jgi:hypothetical protein
MVVIYREEEILPLQYLIFCFKDKLHVIKILEMLQIIHGYEMILISTYAKPTQTYRFQVVKQTSIVGNKINKW